MTQLSMTAIQFDALLGKLDACSEARQWASGKSLVEVWQTCERGDWMLWLAGKQAGKKGWATRKQVVLAACDCAELALKYVPAGEDRPRMAIETARKWAKGKATIEKVRMARRAAAAYAAAFATYAAAYAAAAAAAAASAAAAAAFAAYAADYAAAFSAYAAAAAASAAAARKSTLKQCADLVRPLLKVE